MSEDIDLNAIRKEKPEESREQEISELREAISRLQAQIQAPSAHESFIQLKPEEQEAKLAEVNRSLPDDDKYTLEEYKQELLAQSTGPGLAKVRLASAKSKLEKLLQK